MSKLGKTKYPTFTHYLMMGAGFATGAALVSVLVTMASLGVKEIYDMIATANPQVLPPMGNGTLYVNGPTSPTNVTGG
jgi:hypothetical protein